MLHRPPPSVAKTAADAVEHANQTNTIIPDTVRALAHTLANAHIVDTDELASTFQQCRPGWQGDADRNKSIQWLMLGGAATEGWLPTVTQQPAKNAAAAAAEPPRLRGVTELAELVEHVDGFIRAAIVSAIRRVDGRVVNKAARIARDSRDCARTAGMPGLRTHYPTVAAALTARQEELVADVVEEHEDELAATLIAAIIAMLDDNPYGIEYADLQTEYAAAVAAAVDVFTRRVETYALELLNEPDGQPESVEDGFNPRPSAAIAAAVVAIAGGSAVIETPNGPVAASRFDRLGVPDVSILAGPIAATAAQQAGVDLQVGYIWQHRTADATAFTVKDGVRDHHAALGNTIATAADGFPIPPGTSFPRGDFYRASDHPDGPDHRGCNCIILTAPIIGDADVPVS